MDRCSPTNKKPQKRGESEVANRWVGRRSGRARADRGRFLLAACRASVTDNYRKAAALVVDPTLTLDRRKRWSCRLVDVSATRSI
jgi:hypothetical protein